MELSRSINQFILRLVLLSCWHASIDSKDVIIESNLGEIRGLTRSFPGEEGQSRDVHMFLGIPYARPPVEQLRFKPPQPTNAWRPKVLDARQFGNICPHPERLLKYLTTSIRKVWPEFSSQKVSEDCMYLNIYVPAGNKEVSYPVLFYIHGGTYVMGTPAREKTPGHILPRLHDVVLVTIQYRLGPFGFFTTGDSVLPGNCGMLDQVAALKWVNENIAAFKGDPKRITIAGNSAGGSSVGLHLLSPLTTGLFQGAILESGVEFSPFAILPLEKAVEKTKFVANKLFCDTNDSNKMVECLRTKDTSDIVYYYQAFPGPVVDKYYLPDTPENLRKQGKAKNVSVIMGFTKHDGYHMLQEKRTLNNVYFRKRIERAIQDPESFGIENHLHARAMADAMEFQYYPWHKMGDPKALKSALIKLFTDYFIIAPTFKAANFHSKHAATYVFLYSHLSSKSENIYVKHSSNVDYGFGAPLANLTSDDYSDEDRNVSLFLMQCYSNFLKYGNPTHGMVGGVNWTKYNVNNGAYMDIKAKPEMLHQFHPSRIAFWNFYVPTLQQQSCTPTSPPRANKTRKSGQGTNCCFQGLVVLCFVTCLFTLIT